MVKKLNSWFFLAWLWVLCVGSTAWAFLPSLCLFWCLNTIITLKTLKKRGEKNQKNNMLIVKITKLKTLEKLGFLNLNLL
jgi:hypothetical protein